MWDICSETYIELCLGGGDSIAQIAVMLEILRKISKMENPLRHSIVFLFNGAEEIGLLGAHAFITQHKWAKDVKYEGS
jgi:Zn-dependent M28 family amino/carboxypeptidase